MRYEAAPIRKDSSAWIFFTWVSFAFSVVVASTGIIFLPVDIWIKGYMAIGLYFVISSSLTLSKTIRDEHEASKLINRISEAKTEKMLTEFDVPAPKTNSLIRNVNS